MTIRKIRRTPVVRVVAPPPPAGRLLSGPAGPPGPPGPDTSAALDSHVESAQPHPAYDTDIPSLTLLFENGLI